MHSQILRNSKMHGTDGRTSASASRAPHREASHRQSERIHEKNPSAAAFIFVKVRSAAVIEVALENATLCGLSGTLLRIDRPLNSGDAPVCTPIELGAIREGMEILLRLVWQSASQM